MNKNTKMLTEKKSEKRNRLKLKKKLSTKY